MDLAYIFSVLLEQNIPGPTLIRLHTEFNAVLGRGRQFEVLGASREIETFCGPSRLRLNLQISFKN